MVHWVPMESNPEVWNKFTVEMGVSGDWQFTDVYGLDPELLAMVPQPAAAVLLLYPISENTEALGKRKLEEGNVCSENVFFMNQTIGNACGTVGILHSLLNNMDRIAVGPTVTNFRKDCEGLSPKDRAKLLETSKDIAEKHETAAQTGQTAAPDAHTKVQLHFVAFTAVDGHLYELDGRKSGPVNWGPCQTGELLEKSAVAVKEYMSCDPEEMRFTVVALSKVN